jgi:hypothetical protein
MSHRSATVAAVYDRRRSRQLLSCRQRSQSRLFRSIEIGMIIAHPAGGIRKSGGSFLSQSVTCIECRQVFEVGPQRCPGCNAGTFLYLTGNENPNSACDELLMVAALARIGVTERIPQSFHPRHRGENGSRAGELTATRQTATV